MIDPGLKDKSVLVTGGNNPHGIGAATARAFAAQGAGVFIHCLRQPYDPKSVPDKKALQTPGLPYFFSQQAKSAEEVVQEIQKAGGKAASWECDLATPKAIPALFDRAEDELGPVDILINNAAEYLADTFVPEQMLKNHDAALWEGGPLMSPISAKSFDHHFAVNTCACALMMAEFARRLREDERPWGRIINVSADCSWGSPGEISYRASKYALESYSRSAAAELGPLGITVNVLSPGPVQTGYIASEAEKELVDEIPLRRVGRPEDIADVILFLASEQARWMTGQVITVHGGHRMALGR
ncbi:MAG: SDR family oxidoreductase [Deltaproteobacteria bacterium]|nr:SDR family oxidoreductase [Deltaproteobacteria bacterium]